MNKNYLAVAALVLSLIALGVVVFVPKGVVERLTEKITSTAVGGVSNFDELATGGPPLKDSPVGLVRSAPIEPIKFSEFAMTIAAGTSTLYIQNTFADFAVIDDVQLLVAGTASSSFTFEVSTSTTGAVPIRSFFDAPLIFPRFIIATSTAQNLLVSNYMLLGTTSPMQSAVSIVPGGIATSTTRQSGVFRSGGTSQQNSVGSVVWRRNEYLVAHLLDGSAFVANTTSCDATANRNGVIGYLVCENATSSARGFNPVLYIRTHATTTPGAE